MRAINTGLKQSTLLEVILAACDGQPLFNILESNFTRQYEIKEDTVMEIKFEEYSQEIMALSYPICTIDQFEIVESLVINDEIGVVESYSPNSMPSKIYLDSDFSIMMDIAEDFDWKVKYIKASISSFP